MKLTTFKRLWFDFPNDYLKSKSELIIRRMIVIEKSTRYDRFLEIGNYIAELKKLAADRRDIEIKRHRLKHRDQGIRFLPTCLKKNQAETTKLCSSGPGYTGMKWPAR